MADDERAANEGPSWAVPERTPATPRPGATPPPGYGAPPLGSGGQPPPGYGGAPGYGAPGYGAPGYGAHGYAPPGYGVPGQGAPGYGAPGPHGAPGYGGGWNAPGANPYGMPYGYGYGYQPTETDKGARNALIISIVGLLFCGVIFGPAAIIEGAKARRRIRESNGRLTGDGMALAGIIIGVLATIGAIYFIFKLSSSPTTSTRTTVTTRLR